MPAKKTPPRDEKPQKQRFEEALDAARGAGATIVEVECPSFVYALAAYYLILPAEASSNLAKFDGVRFGLREERETIERTMAATRAKGFFHARRTTRTASTNDRERRWHRSRRRSPLRCARAPRRLRRPPRQAPVKP